MQIEIKFSRKINPVIYSEYSKFVYSQMRSDIIKSVRRNSKKYKVREKFILESDLIRWKSKPPTKINLLYYLENSIELVNIKGTYIIRLNDSWLVKGSITKVKTLVRILEYGTLKIPQLPVIRRVFNYYSENYQNLFTEFMKERLLDYEFLSLR